MKRKIVAIGIAPLIFACNSMTLQAATCPYSPDGVHHLSSNAHRSSGMGYSVDKGTHTYLWGYDVDENPIYKDNCKITESYEYCRFACNYCGAVDNDSPYHTHCTTHHSINHN